MRRDDLITRLKAAEPSLRAFGVASLHLFGSYARDEARPDSDVDVFVDPASDERFGFLQFMHAYEALHKSVGQDVELGYSTRTGLSPWIMDAIESEAIRVF